ncbi:MAG: fibronectin type III domain-containing protein, partial [Actinomycetota bacterium]|nr:fibronectin type III domain-containing protein [Actinomycetota bacterium]
TSQLATARWTAPNGLDKVVPATGNTARLSFLLHAADGWSVVSTAADGSDLRGPTRLAALTTTADLVAPAASRGALYTMDTDSGQLIRIDGVGRARALDGAANYPLTEQAGRSIEPTGFGDAYVVARGSRVIYNSPNHLRALVVFTDGSHGPLDIEKSSAVTVNAAGGAAALTRSRLNNQTDKPPPGKPGVAPKPVDPVNNKIDCKSTAQKPHIPLMGQPIPGSRSVQLTWTYPTVGQQDCIPSTYVLNVKLLSTDAPSPPSQVTVQGQRSVNLTGLFPSKRYEISVTAYINGRGTESTPIDVTTGPEGPAAPLNVNVHTDAAGNWLVSWASCGSVKAGCVPSASWTVIPEFCDGRGLSGPPAPLDVTADPTAVKQPGAILRGGDALLGRGVRFTVEGIGDNGSTGEPSGYTACTTSWSPSVAAGMQLSATKPNDTPAGGSSSTIVALNLGANPVHAVGGVGAQITLKLTGPGGTNSITGTFAAQTDTVQTQFNNIRPGATYTATATVSPPGHPGNGIGIGPVDLVTRSSWPALSVTDAQCPSSGPLTLSCDLSFRIAGISSASAGGETFDLTSDSDLQCGQAALPLVRNDFDPATGFVTVKKIPQLNNLFGSCTVTIGLVEHNPPQPAYFGGTRSASASSSVDLGQQASLGAGNGDFAATWLPNSSSVQVTYTGGNPTLSLLTNSWSETVNGPDGSPCGSGISVPTTPPILVDAGCVGRLGANSGWSVSITYHDTIGGAPHSATADLPGPPPSYRPCAPAGFVAAWGNTRADGVTVIAGGDLSG